MPLLDRPDFQAWLARFEARHARLHSAGLQPAGGRCDGCGEPIPEPVSTTGLCLVCLAETFGREQAQSAAGGAAGQTEKILSNVKEVLAAAGKTLDDVVKANVYLQSMEDFAAMNEVYVKHFKAPYPARTAIGVAALPLNARVEMEFIAR